METRLVARPRSQVVGSGVKPDEIGNGVPAKNWCRPRSPETETPLDTQSATTHTAPWPGADTPPAPRRTHPTLALRDGRRGPDRDQDHPVPPAGYVLLRRGLPGPGCLPVPRDRPSRGMALAHRRGNHGGTGYPPDPACAGDQHRSEGDEQRLKRMCPETSRPQAMRPGTLEAVFVAIASISVAAAAAAIISSTPRPKQPPPRRTPDLPSCGFDITRCGLRWVGWQWCRHDISWNEPQPRHRRQLHPRRSAGPRSDPGRRTRGQPGDGDQPAPLDPADLGNPRRRSSSSSKLRRALTASV